MQMTTFYSSHFKNHTKLFDLKRKYFTYRSSKARLIWQFIFLKSNAYLVNHISILVCLSIRMYVQFIFKFSWKTY